MNKKEFTITIAGGGSTWTPGLLKALCKRKGTFPLKRVVLFDNNPERQEVIGEFAKVLFKEEYPTV
ncbi:MAG: 6-phospho-alpha-glucosidase, partial [Cetobacterium sp.]